MKNMNTFKYRNEKVSTVPAWHFKYCTETTILTAGNYKFRHHNTDGVGVLFAKIMEIHFEKELDYHKKDIARFCYGASIDKKSKKLVLRGDMGLSSMQNILRFLGYGYIYTETKDTATYTIVARTNKDKTYFKSFLKNRYNK